MKKILMEVFILGLAGLLLLVAGQQTLAAQPLAAAGTATPAATPVVTPSPAPLTPNQLDSVWGSSASDIFAVGRMGTILHYDGQAWSPMNSGTINELYTMWGSSASDVFAVGQVGTILHYDGSSWSQMKSGGISSINIVGVWGSSASDVFVVGEAGTILHYDGATWSPIKSGTYNDLFAVWGSSGKDIYVVGSGGRILHYDGSTWSPMNNDVTADLLSVWGSSTNDIFAVGSGGAILHYDGTTWSPMKSGILNELYTVWGNSASDVFTVGGGGTILHYDGNEWSPIPSGKTDALVGVWGSSANDVFAVGSRGTILHYDGQAWSDMSSGLPAALPVAEAPSAKILFIGDSLISWNYGLDQQIERLAASANPPLAIEAEIVSIPYGPLEKMWQETKAAEMIGAGNYEVVVLQENLWATDVDTFYEYARKFDAEIKKTGAKTVLFMPWQINYLELTSADIAQAHRTIAPELGAEVAPVGLAWQRALTERPDLKLVEVDGIHPTIHGTYLATTVVYATLFDQLPNSTTYLPSAPYHKCATEEQEEANDAAAESEAAERVPGCMAEEEAAFLQRIAWETVQEYMAEAAPVASQPAPLTSYNLNSVWGSSSTDVFAVGELGTILHYDGSAWSPMESRTAKNFTGVWGSSPGDVFVTGTSGAILHYDGAAWSKMDSGWTMGIMGVWGSSSSDVFAVGEGGIILHYDSAAWSPILSGVFETLTGVWGSSGTDIFVVGGDGRILHYDGQTWSPQDSGTTEQLWGVWGSSSTDVFAVGDFGTILHYDGQAWSPMESGTAEKLSGVWGSSGSDVFITGAVGAILHYDGTVWSPMSSGMPAQEIAGVRGSSGSDIFAVGYEGAILHYDGEVWSDMRSGTPTTVSVSQTPTPQGTVEVIPEKITSQALADNLLGDPAERRVFVVLPPGYATSEKRYPVLYLIPWADGEPGDNASGFKWTMQSLLRKGEIGEMIVVVPDGSNKLGASHFRNSPAIGDYETYMTQEVVNYVDMHYRTLPTRDSRGLAGCSNGGGPVMRLALKYPNIFSVAAPTDGVYDESLELWPADVETVQGLKELPQDIISLKRNETVAWYVQMAAGSAPDPDNPPFYSEMPIRIVNGRGEFVPEVIAKIVAQDAAHEARRYVEQPQRLRGILIRHALQDSDYTRSTHSFDQLLTDLGIEHEYVEIEGNHCGYGWEAASLKYMADKLVFEE